MQSTRSIGNGSTIEEPTTFREPTLIERIARHARTNPDQLAVADDQRRLTYAELEREANHLALNLVARGAGPEVCLGVWFERSVDFVVAALATLKTGAAYLPLDASTPPERIHAILEDADAKLLLTHRDKAASLENHHLPVVDLDRDHFAPAASNQPTANASQFHPQQLAYVIYTSGSTGKPKGVEVTHANLCALVAWHQRAFDVTRIDRGSMIAGFGFDATVWELWPYLAAGASLFIADEMTRRSSRLLRDWLLEKRVTVSFAPTLLAEQLLHESWPENAPLRILLTGADTLHQRPSQPLPFTLVNNYGPTECTVVATSGVVAPGEVAQGIPSIGRPIDGTQIYLLDESLQPVPANCEGEICIAGEGVARGYRGRPELTQEKFVSLSIGANPPTRIYRTGDRARRLESGELVFLGRLDDQVKIRGNRVELGEIITALCLYPGIDSATVALKSGALTAYLVPDINVRMTATDLRAYLSARLPDYMIPDRYVTLTELPLTPNGKIDKGALPDPSPTNQLPETTDESPATGTGGIEETLTSIIAALLERDGVAPEENFFLLGGHSMLGVQLVSRIRDAFGVKLTLRQLFNAPTIAALSLELQRRTLENSATAR